MTNLQAGRLERRGRRQSDESEHGGAILRTVLSGLILAGIVGVIGAQWSGRSQMAGVQAEGRQQASDSRVQFATIIAQIANMQLNIADVPQLREKVTQLETNQLELIRRVNAEEAVHAKTGHGE